MRRVLHVIETMAPREGGPPRVVAGLAAAQRSMGIDAHVLCDDGPLLKEYLQHWEAQTAGFPSQGVHAMAERPINLISRALALRKWLHKHLRTYDIVHIHQPWRLVPTLAASACRRLGVPYLITPHTALSKWALTQKKMKKALARKLIWNRLFKAAAGFHALNALEAAEIIETVVGRNGPPVFVVPNGVPLAEFSGAPLADCPAIAGAALTPPEGERPFLLFLARLHTMKGPDLLLNAFATAAYGQPALQLAFAGPDFGMMEQLRRRAAELGLRDRVHFLGLVSGPDRLWLLQNAVCLCQTSRDEGFSLSILEAMACGKPVVISDRCKFPEVAQYGAGMIVSLSVAEIAAALSLYANEPVRRGRDGQAARLLIERFYTWDIVSKQADQMYTRAIGGQSALAVSSCGLQ